MRPRGQGQGLDLRGQGLQNVSSRTPLLLNSMFTEILDNIDGYILKKTAQKYAEAEHTIKVLRMDQPEGEFAKKWQKYQILPPSTKTSGIFYQRLHAAQL